MKIQTLLTICLFVCLSLGFIQSCDQPEAKPNIVLILADDMGYGDPECYNSDSKIPTPNLNTLSEHGIRFTDAHSPSAVCSPTRYGILTGRYAWRSPLKKAVLWPWDSPLIEKDRMTLGKMLQEAGYSTACIGKWHLGWNWQTTDGRSLNDSISIGTLNGHPYRRSFYQYVDLKQPMTDGPTERGFDYYYGDDVPNFPPYTFIENNRLLTQPDTLNGLGEWGAPGPKCSGWRFEQVMIELTEKAVDYILADPAENRFNREPGEPFFLYFSLTAPHTPIAPSDPFIGSSAAGLYGDYVHEVDWSVGCIVQALKETGQLYNTLLIYTSDNGSPERDGSNFSGPVGSVRKYGHLPNYTWRGHKADIWEGGHRVPFIVHWPNRYPGGIEESTTICHIDLMATLAAILGVTLPETAAPDSYSMATLWSGQTDQYARPEPIVHHSIHGMFAIRRGPWKFINGVGSGGWATTPDPGPWPGQLYNLTTDPGEQANLYDSEPDMRETLQQELSDIIHSNR